MDTIVTCGQGAGSYSPSIQKGENTSVKSQSMMGVGHFVAFAFRPLPNGKMIPLKNLCWRFAGMILFLILVLQVLAFLYFLQPPFCYNRIRRAGEIQNTEQEEGPRGLDPALRGIPQGGIPQELSFTLTERHKSKHVVCLRANMVGGSPPQNSLLLLDRSCNERSGSRSSFYTCPGTVLVGARQFRPAGWTDLRLN